MSDSGVTFADTSIEVLTQKMIAMLKSYAASQNKQAVDAFKGKMDAWHKDVAFRQANNQPLQPQPVPPMIMFLNEEVVRQNEQGTGEKDWSSVFSSVPYVYIAPPSAATHPPVVIGQEDVSYPGFYDTVSGDGPWVPVGYKQPQDGHEYTKTVVSHSPFAPGGLVTLFQLTA
jgi:hypothetical protein